ncbi:MAG: hypothetical protein ABIW81_05500 [Terrimesophilobacter sp.]
MSVAISLSLIKVPGGAVATHSEVGKSPVGLIAGDDSRFAVDLAYFMPGMFLIGRVASANEPPPPQPSISVAAVSWSPAVDPNTARSFVLYSDTIGSPGVWYDNDQPSAADMRSLMLNGGPLEVESPQTYAR